MSFAECIRSAIDQNAISQKEGEDLLRRFEELRAQFGLDLDGGAARLVRPHRQGARGRRHGQRHCSLPRLSGWTAPPPSPNVSVPVTNANAPATPSAPPANTSPSQRKRHEHGNGRNG